MSDQLDLAALEAEVAELERQAGIAKQPKKRAAKKAAPKGSGTNGKGEMPPRGTPEWEEWQQRQAGIGKSNHGGYAGKTLLEKSQDALDSQMRRLDKLRIGTGDYLTARGRCEGLACGIGILRGTNMSHEMHNSEKRIHPKEASE